MILLSPNSTEYLILICCILGFLSRGRQQVFICMSVFLSTLKIVLAFGHRICYTSVLFILVDFIFESMPSIYFTNGSTDTINFQVNKSHIFFYYFFLISCFVHLWITLFFGHVQATHQFSSASSCAWFKINIFLVKEAKMWCKTWQVRASPGGLLRCLTSSQSTTQLEQRL